MRAAKREQERAWKQAMKVRAWPPAMRFVAGELELRGFTAYDIEPFYRSIDAEVRHWQGYDQRHVDGYGWLLQVAVRYPNKVPPHRLLAVIREGQFAGTYTLTPSTGWRDRWDVELGWWLAPEARGRGLGRASLAAVLTHVHGDLGLRVARMGTEVDNVRAVRQIEAAGAVPVREGPHTLPNGRVITGRWYHHVAG